MSVRVMVDGKPYPRTQETKVRPYHKPVPIYEPPTWKCAVCGEPWGWVVVRLAGARRDYRRHYPGTFWERD